MLGCGVFPDTSIESLPMSLFKYFNEPGGANTTHREPLKWITGEDMAPLRGVEKTALTQSEFERIEPAVDFHCGRFRLWIEEEHAAYCDIRDRAANGWYQILDIERIVDPEHNARIVFLEWIQVYNEIPNAKLPPDRTEVPQIALGTTG